MTISYNVFQYITFIILKSYLPPSSSSISNISFSYLECFLVLTSFHLYSCYYTNSIIISLRQVIVNGEVGDNENIRSSCIKFGGVISVPDRFTASKYKRRSLFEGVDGDARAS